MAFGLPAVEDQEVERVLLEIERRLQVGPLLLQDGKGRKWKVSGTDKGLEVAVGEQTVAVITPEGLEAK